MRKAVLTTIMLVMVMTSIMAVPAYHGIITKTMPDGSTIDLLLFGDEYFSYMTTTDGYLVTRTADGYYQRQGKFQMSDLDIQNARKSSVMYSKKPADKRIVRETADSSLTRNLVILVNFADEAFTYTQADFDSMFNQQGYSAGGATGSVREYFADNSYGQYMPVFDVYGPVTLDSNKVYYGAPTEDDRDVRPAQMVLDAVRKLNQDSSVTVDWSLYDCDGDGEMDNVIIYFAGYGENMGANDTCIWPHQWYVTSWNTNITSDSDRTFGGKLLSKYICMNEIYLNTGSRMCGIGTFCHEFSHALGLMDLYVTDNSSAHKALGNWDVMNSGSYNHEERTPAGYSMFERFYLGWSKPVILNQPVTVSLRNTMTQNQSFIVTSNGEFNYDPLYPEPDTFFVFENRQLTKWDAYLPGHGMLVEKISWNRIKWFANVANNDPLDMVVDIIEAGNSTLQRGSNTDPFPGAYNIDIFTPYLYYQLTNITESDSIVTFDFMGGSPGPFTVYFNAGENGTPDTTSLSQEDYGDIITLPSVTPDSGLVFEGWCDYIEAAEVNVGVAGDEIMPVKDMLLHAVYSVDGQIIPLSFEGCFTEKFSKLNTQKLEDITMDIDDYTDNAGWTGNSLINDFGTLLVGRSDIKGTIKTPAIGCQGNVDVTLVLAQDAATYIGVVAEDKSAADYALVEKGMGVAYLHLDYVTPNVRLDISSDLNFFGIKAIYICGEELPADVEIIVEEQKPVLLRNADGMGKARVERLEPGSIVRVIDAIGRILTQEETDGDIYEFTAPDCFYLVEIINGNNRKILK